MNSAKLMAGRPAGKLATPSAAAMAAGTMKLSILIPVFNERYLVAELLRRVLAAPLPAEIETAQLIVVDDGSTDQSGNEIARIASANGDRIVHLTHDRNRGKGAAIRTALEHADGDFCLFQDADLEYDVNDYSRLLAPLIAGQADVVYGSRFIPSERRRVLYFWHGVGNRFLNTLCNATSDLSLTDAGTCYKAFRTRVLLTIPIRSDQFGIDWELTLKVAKRGLRVYEVPINYDGRSYLEGKKTGWRDGVSALGTLIHYWAVDDLYDERTGHEILANLSRAHRFNRWMADVVRPYLGHRVLEIGAGIGNLTVQFLPRDHYIASELDELHLEVLRNMALRRPELHVTKIDVQEAEQLAPLDQQIDTAVALNVIEHVPDADAALRNLAQALTPGGRVVILVPQGQWLYSPLDKYLEHVKRYERDDLRKLLERHGFVVDALFDFNRIAVLGWWLNGKLLRRTRMAKYQLKVYDMLVWLWRRIDWLLPWHGLSLVVVGRKPAAVNSTATAPTLSVADTRE